MIINAIAALKQIFPLSRQQFRTEGDVMEAVFIWQANNGERRCFGHEASMNEERSKVGAQVHISIWSL